MKAAFSIASGFLVLMVVGLVSSSASAQESLVRNGHLSICPKKTLDQMVTGFIEDPKWETKRIDEKLVGVAVGGQVFVHGKKTPIKLIFVANEESNTFSYEALKLNNEPAAKLIGNGILMKMCAA